MVHLSQSREESDAFAIDAVYQPAQEVGGDFYRILEDAGGDRVIVVGDVSGKGLKAAMLVSLILGALRNTKERRPQALLAELNHVVYGQIDGGFVTCCCARVGTDGTVDIANAGQLAPYLSGREIDIAGGLPLGISKDINYPASTISFSDCEQLTFLSDGVVEAINERGELLGFERTRALSDKPAAEIAEAARKWGHNDDITIVTVRRNGEEPRY